MSLSPSRSKRKRGELAQKSVKVTAMSGFSHGPQPNMTRGREENSWREEEERDEEEQMNFEWEKSGRTMRL